MLNLQKLYFVLYNGVMCAGWSSILYKVAEHFHSGGSADGVYAKVALPLVVFQTGAVAEVIHAMTGLVRSPVATTFLQVLSRLIVLYGAVEIGDSDARKSPIFVQMVIAWSLSEIIRYAFYTLNTFHLKPKLLTWLRYSAFMVLYPVGITGEFGCLYKALPYIHENKTWTVQLPNTMNFVFNWYYMVIFILVGIYPYGSYVMYTYMLSQRRKVLARTVAEVKKTA